MVVHDMANSRLVFYLQTYETTNDVGRKEPLTLVAAAQAARDFLAFAGEATLLNRYSGHKETSPCHFSKN
jgi:hypothetical protein